MFTTGLGGGGRALRELPPFWCLSSRFVGVFEGDSFPFGDIADPTAAAKKLEMSIPSFAAPSAAFTVFGACFVGTELTSKSGLVP